MLERFTSDARRVVVVAQETARELDSPKIDSRHLLAGLALGGPAANALRAVHQDPTDLARRIRTALSADDELNAEALAALGVDLDAVSAKADELFGEGALHRARKKRARRRIPFSPDAKKALELGLKAAIRLQENEIGGSHVLLGILDQDCPARTLLGATGADLAALRAELEHPEAA